MLDSQSHVTESSSLSRRTAVLVADDDVGMRESVRLVLGAIGIEVHEADTGAAAIVQAGCRPFDLAMIDLRLPDVSGLLVASSLRDAGVAVPWLLMSGWMTVSVAVEAMRLGAIDAVEVPFDIEVVVHAALKRSTGERDVAWPTGRMTQFLLDPKSMADRWVSVVLRGCDAEHDLKTVEEWAACVGVSHSGLKEICKLVSVQPQDARDLVRILRALIRHGGRLDSFEADLNVSDQRTLQNLLKRAGLADVARGQRVSLSEFFARQRFVDSRRSIVALIESTMRQGCAPSGDPRDSV